MSMNRTGTRLQAGPHSTLSLVGGWNTRNAKQGKVDDFWKGLCAAVAQSWLKTGMTIAWRRGYRSGGI